MVVQARQCVWLTEGDVNRFNIENHTLNVVRSGDFTAIEPRLTCRRVVKDGLNFDHVHARKEFMACNDIHAGVFCVNVGAGNGVCIVFNEGKLLQRNVVERNTLEAVIHSVSSIIIRLEFEVDVDHGA